MLLDDDKAYVFKTLATLFHRHNRGVDTAMNNAKQHMTTIDHCVAHLSERLAVVVWVFRCILSAGIDINMPSQYIIVNIIRRAFDLDRNASEEDVETADHFKRIGQGVRDVIHDCFIVKPQIKASFAGNINEFSITTFTINSRWH